MQTIILILYSSCLLITLPFFFFFQAEDGIRDSSTSRGLGDVYKRQVLEVETKTESGIFLASSTKERPSEGTVIAVGPGKLCDNGERVKPEVEVGNTVMFSKYAGTEFKIDGVDHLIISEKDILAVL